MNILVITGSPHRKGTSALLADEFIAGASSKGHKVVRFDAAFEDIKPCLACDYCLTRQGVCCQKDAFEKLKGDLVSTDMVVFVTPLYYMGMSAQLKHAIDRFYAVDGHLKSSHKKTAMLATAGSMDNDGMNALTAHYKALCHYFGWEDCGTVMVRDVYERADIEKTDAPARARALGESL